MRARGYSGNGEFRAEDIGPVFAPRHAIVNDQRDNDTLGISIAISNVLAGVTAPLTKSLHAAPRVAVTERPFWSLVHDVRERGIAQSFGIAKRRERLDLLQETKCLIDNAAAFFAGSIRHAGNDELGVLLGGRPSVIKFCQYLGRELFCVGNGGNPDEKRWNSQKVHDF